MGFVLPFGLNPPTKVLTLDTFFPALVLAPVPAGCGSVLRTGSNVAIGAVLVPSPLPL